MSAEPAPATRSHPTIARLEALVGHELGISAWRAVTQDEIDRFAEVTDDPQYIHVDPVRAAASPFGGTIAHGFLTLSLLSTLSRGAVNLEGRRMGVNYGFEKVRFVAPVRSGARIRGRFVLKGLEHRAENEIMLRYAVTVEIEGGAKPALVAEWLSLAVF
jgi:acyl dehydratase